MYRIFAFVGSMQSENSVTYKETLKLIKAIIKISDKKVEYNIVTAKNKSIEICRGCQLCFKEGHCSISSDELEKIKEYMIQADLIIFSSPVYAHNVSASMKNFIDRIAYWTHLFRLTGKYGIIITTSSYSGNIIVEDYLCKIMNYLGINIIDSLNITLINQNSQEVYEKRNKIAKNYVDLNKGFIKLNTSKFQEKVYGDFRKYYKLIGKKYPDNIEYKYWSENNYFKFDRFEELFYNIRYKNDY